jgi:lysophospholipase L1-like esterase
VTPHWRLSPRRSGLVASVAVVCTLVLAAQPALAAPSPGLKGAVPGKADPVLVGGADSHPVRPGPVLIPRKGTTVAPLASPLKPTAAKALPGAGQAKGSALAPGSVAGNPSALRRVAPSAAHAADIPGDDTGGTYYCQEAISGGTGVGSNESIGPYSDTQYLAQLGCNFYLDYAYGVSGVVDRTPGYDGTLLYVGSAFSFSGYYYGASSGAFRIPGDLYDGGRQMELIFELYLLAPYGLIWGACGPLPGLRYLACDGLGTDLLHIVVGTGVLGTGLAPPVMRSVSLGDSYSSGTGTGSYISDIPSCRRSPLAYPNLLSGSILGNLPLDVPSLKACHGARISDLYITQVGWLNVNRTRFVTITIGGNDMGFATTLRQCATPFAGDCGANGPLIPPAVLAQTRADLTAAYRTIRSMMRSDGYLVVVGYPQFTPVPGVDPDPNADVRAALTCPAIASTFSTAELTAIATAVVQADNMIAGAVADTGDPHVVFVDAYNAFAGHRLCSTNGEWSNGIRLDDQEESFHPNAMGYQALSNVVSQRLGLHR